MGGEKGEGFSGTTIKDTWTKPKGVRIKGGKWGWLVCGVVVGGKWRHLYLNNNKKKRVVYAWSSERAIYHHGGRGYCTDALTKVVG